MGVELQRVRPAVIVNSPAFDGVPVRIVVPLTTWQAQFQNSGNKLLIEANDRNGLDADSAADFLQVCSVSGERLVERLGHVDADLVGEIVAGVAIAIDYQA